MKPTVSNAFNDGSSNPAGKQPAPGIEKARQPRQAGPRHPHRSLAAALVPMQVELCEADFGWSLDLSPMQAIDALQALRFLDIDPASISFLVALEQSAWRDGEQEMPLADIAQRLALPVIQRMSDGRLVMNELSLRQLVSLCQPTRLVVVAIEGGIDERDAAAIKAALDAGRSPLLAELRALAALEVVGDRSVVLQTRDKNQALALVADNFRHYLAALTNRPATQFEAPQLWQIERLLSLDGMITIRPIETQIFSTSIDVGVNTTRKRFSRPADQSLIFDIPSNTWHDEP